ncbi:MAG: DOMON domain-containing protein [Chitinivibrionales bacterium]|nr:DOMON domain-containing protein [Chitinivibrionales bacterium]
MKTKIRKYVSLILCAGFYGACFAAEAPSPAAAATNDMKTIMVKGFTFSYKVENQNLVARVSCATAGWIGVGFNPKFFMKGANLIIGYADGANGVLRDDYANGMFKHDADTALGGKNDIIAGSCIESNGVATLSFTIPLNSGDSKDVVLEPGKKVKLVFATCKEKNLKTKHNKKVETEIVL